MRLQEIMSHPVHTIPETASLIMANELMWRQQIHHLVVMQENNIVGIVSDTDLGGPDAESIPGDRQVKAVMSTKIVTAKPDTTLKDAINLMEGHAIRCMPVLDEENNLVGIVTTRDIERLDKRGVAQPPFQGTQGSRTRQGPYVELQKRTQRGGTTPYGQQH